ncbi:tektin-1 [Genypterus blacodes]|uniref:tektin-1 n=1 Tax=Genypterus blacodes TaxID=154954 RepID=UPI003F776403
MSMDEQNLDQAAGPNLMSIERKRNHSELFIEESKRLIMECEKASKRMQHNADKRLDQRVRDIRFLKKELEIKLEEIILEIESLIVLSNRVEKALEACQEPLRVTMVCLEERKKRSHREKQHDEVYGELLMEKEGIERTAALLHKLIEQIGEQIRLNRSAKYHIEKDLKEKFEAQGIDDCCALMTRHSLNNHQMASENAALPIMAVTPKEWENISDINLTKAEEQKANTLSLKALVESVLDQTASDMQFQFHATVTAFAVNIREIKDAKNKMEDHLSRIMTECNCQQRNMDELLQAIREKENFLSVAEARLSLRSQRPGKEQCHDPAQAMLLAEVQEHTSQINKMRTAVAQSEEKLRILVSCQVELKENIKIKANSLYIDEVVCTNIRRPVIIQNF